MAGELELRREEAALEGWVRLMERTRRRPRASGWGWTIGAVIIRSIIFYGACHSFIFRGHRVICPSCGTENPGIRSLCSACGETLIPAWVPRPKLTRRVRIVAALAAVRGIASSGFVLWLTASEPASFARLLEDDELAVGARFVGILLSGVLEVVCATFLWWRNSLVAAYVLVAYSSFDAIYKYTLGRSPLLSLAFAVLYVVAIRAIDDLRAEQKHTEVA